MMMNKDDDEQAGHHEGQLLMEWVTSLLQNRLPELDDDMREYLIPLLLQPILGEDEDGDAGSLHHDDDVDDNEWSAMIREMLQDYPDQAQQLIQQILEKRATEQSTRVSNAMKKEDNICRVKQTRFIENDPPLLQDEGKDEVQEIETQENQTKTISSTTTKAKKTTKKNSRQAKHQHKPLHHHDASSQPTSLQQDSSTTLEFWDDDATAWQERQAQGQAWGGRGHGGRGVRGDVNTATNLHLVNVSITLPSGQELLQNATIQINGKTTAITSTGTVSQQHHHIYGLIGRNGSGKSTLLRRLYQKAIPGMPMNMNIVLVQQQVTASSTQTALQCLLEADTLRSQLLQEHEELERQLQADDDDDDDDERQELPDVAGNLKETNDHHRNHRDLAKVAQRLNDVTTQLDLIDADSAPDRATEILKGLQFTPAMVTEIPTEHLSGGWRMRLALAKALFAGAHADLWLLDEVTNHLDLHAQVWLTRYLQEQAEPTVILVSHDRAFLDAVCTDIMVLEHALLHYHVGNYSEYERQQEEKAAREAQILDAAERQRTKAEAFIQKYQQSQPPANSKKQVDPNKQRQAKMIKDKKLDRIGNYREDGKRYKLRSLKKLSEDSLRLAQKVEVEVDEPVVKLRFPNPSWPPGIHQPDSTLVRLDDFSFGYSPTSKQCLIKDVTLQIQRSSKIAMVGKNGAGKSTLLKLIAGDIDTTKHYTKGELWRHANLRIGHVTQYSVEELESFASTMTVVEYAEEKLRSGKASSSIVNAASGNVRQYLGGFGLGGKHAHRPIGTLSGGERMRLCFATVLAEEPHLLILDESTNHLDLETLDALAAALKAYQGAVVMVSHNQGFLNGFCQGLWMLGENGHIDVRYCDEDVTFDDIFTQYRDELFSGSASESRSSKRQQKATMAKRAANQSANARGHTSLL